MLAFDQATGAPVGISSGIGQSSAVQSLVYTWDGYGNLTERQDANQNLSETFQYDDLNRLTHSTVTNPNNNGPSLSLGYDAMGNIQANSNLGTYAYTPNHPEAVASVTDSAGSVVYSASYDADDPWKSQTWDGDMTTRNGFPLTWTVDDVQGCTSVARPLEVPGGGGGRMPGAANLPASIASATGVNFHRMEPADFQVMAPLDFH